MNTSRSRWPRTLVAVAIIGTATLAPAPQAGGVGAATGCDFDADGFEEIVVGAPLDDAGARDAGSVIVMHGAPDAPFGERSEMWKQNRIGVGDVAEPGDLFGAAHACGDFDGDGFGDLAVGAPGDSVASQAQAGLIHVFYGSRLGLTADRDQKWTAQRAGFEAGDHGRLGSALAVADVNGDAVDDIVIGAPGAASGSIYVLFGSRGGLRAAGAERWSPGDNLKPGHQKPGWEFGAAIDTGDLDGDGILDFVVGSPGAGLYPGAIHILYGTAAGLDPTGHRIVQFSTEGIKGSGSKDSRLGRSVAVGDLDGDGRDDVAAGAPGQAGTGTVTVLYGSANRAGMRDDYVHPPPVATGSLFGHSVVIADITAVPGLELVVGMPWGGIDRNEAGGLVAVWSGLEPFQRAPTAIVTAEPSGGGEAFGASVDTGDFLGDGMSDLLVGVPGHDVGTELDAGGFAIVPSSPEAASAVVEVISSGTPGVRGAPRLGDRLGAVGAAWTALPATPASLAILPRSSWDATDPVPALLTRHEINEITIHHAGTLAGTRGPAQFRGWQNWHMDGRGWGDIAYHYLVGHDGTVYAGRDVRFEGDTGTSYDTSGHLQIVLEGNFDEERPTARQLDSLALVVAWAVEEYGVPFDAIGGHRDRASTSCPGSHLYPHIAGGDLRDRVSAIIEAGGVEVR